tara:strand:+ start:262 stop:600 length:339 start_codon:yes stop_codon:yes gene_type:complete
MASKITVSIDTDKTRQLVVEDTYKNKKGDDVKVQRIKFELVEMKEESQKVIYDHEKFQLIKTHFAVKPQTKEERAAKADAVFVGEGVSQRWKSDSQGQSSSNAQPPIDDLPF